MADDYRFGIEEEYFLAAADSGRSPATGAADAFHQAAARKVKAASHELLKGQVEVATEPSTDFAAARESLHALRTRLSDIARSNDLLLFAAGSHPRAESRHQQTTQKERYEQIESEFGIITKHTMVCAMHVHLEVPRPDERIDLVRRLLPWLPMFLALSVSSPFWQQRDSGLRGFRLSAFSQWPRMGMPELFTTKAQFDDYVDLLVRTGRIDDASFVWWYLRPSVRYPTVELRICDSCTSVDDAIAIAALYRCLVRATCRRPDLNARVGAVERGVCAENIWQAQRAGLDAHFIDTTTRRLAPATEWIEKTLAFVAEDADALGCAHWLARVRDTMTRGTSAERQLAAHHRALNDGASDEAALLAVIEMLASETTAPPRDAAA